MNSPVETIFTQRRHEPGLQAQAMAEHNAATQARILGVATATTERCYTQRELLDRFKITDRRIRSVFLNGGIEKRFLTLPEASDAGPPVTESQGELLGKHKAQAVAMGTRAVLSCCEQLGVSKDEIAYLCCVSTTGFLTPGLSAHISKALELPRSCGRLDIVGMGCNAGLNALNPVSNWARVNPGKLAMMLCVEVCSAAYVFDGSIETAVVNSLFGDGAAALALMGGELGTAGQGDAGGGAPQIVKFFSCLIPDAIHAMRYDWDEEQGKFSFYLDRDVPYVVGAHAEHVIGNLLKDTGLRQNDIAHWVVHSGGKKVIDSVRVNLGLTKDDVRHTMSVLADYGNLSSGSFLFSYQRLLAEGKVKRGDHGVFMTMGPGSTIESALVRW
ncbi:3,5-dihydroxyphenylacetyl-CoA synthase DpgA [Paucibacter sp. APW11]|uniref:3,5-dihydroxyphenylacetyl-CoA synthase DpgA n=1 Tax=Roseateles aquae TaxID=3077235 RepID=A0ABU3PHQ9_9BURK|nr:3,5-dihydroxyphenylacetyl-CoA synthase DpgA [Paucibacter sp. APW11]MDT9002106.1 3,5-dihydroxyphenylacetyl-CoA synthase DpgA [Paucibacter sp. APW11]